MSCLLKQDNTNHGEISTLLQSHCQVWHNERRYDGHMSDQMTVA